MFGEFQTLNVVRQQLILSSIRLQTQTNTVPRQFSGPLDVIRQLRQASGVAGVFRGITPTLLREGHGMGYVFLL